MKKQGLNAKEMLGAEKAAVERAENSIRTWAEWESRIKGANDEQKRYLVRVMERVFNDDSDQRRLKTTEENK